MSRTNDIFTRVFTADSTVDLDFKREWMEGGGYFGPLVHEQVIDGPVGTIGRFTTPQPNNRRVLVLKTDFGNIVVFNRYTPGHGEQVFASNLPHYIERILRPGRPINEDGMGLIFGFFGSDTNFAVNLHNLVVMEPSHRNFDLWEHRKAARS